MKWSVPEKEWNGDAFHKKPFPFHFHSILFHSIRFVPFIPFHSNHSNRVFYSSSVEKEDDSTLDNKLQWL
ncbi:hypothetical protein BpHYR1_035887 [Brachionus plicatilis]|uniref:Uncharacterized protein n=1 Tax=Brachionus plicatilis TaxID=10195 RepID=A0A3M7QV97_BRAPC|nr:hypothetical protein BpHYR1_035887 [Brachionus plicatilis]